MPPIVAAWLAVLAGPWLFRTLAVLEHENGAWQENVRGFAADLAMAVLVLGVCWALARIGRWLGVALACALTLGYYANYETIAALGSIASPLDLKFFGDPTFVKGSALAIVHPFVLAAVLLAVVLCGWRGFAGRRLADAGLAVAAGAFALGVLSFIPPNDDAAPWQQENAVAYNVEWLAGRGGGRERGDYADPAAAMRELVPGVAADLAAPHRFPGSTPATNVLLVVLESVSGHYLPSAAAVHGRPPFNPLPNLDRAFAENVGFATFINHQRRTNRGLYTLLCGEYPRLVVGLPKMSVAAAAPWRRCLPEALRQHGYHTVYLQGAPLPFMQKDRFMPAAGFDRTLGHDAFANPHFRTFWGVDDRSLFDQALIELDALEADGKPWFLTLLNVGTHHPYTVPPFESPYTSDFRRAFAYLDVAFGRFLAEVERRGLRDDTLILVTSDESRGDLGQAEDGTAAILSENWGLLIALLPERTRAVVEAPFAQSDVALSVLDYLGLAEDDADFLGRSVFRKYEHGRPVFYGNVNYRMIGGLLADGSLVQCQHEGRKGCARYQPVDGKLFADPLPRSSVPPGADADTVREMARRSLPPAADGTLVLPLLAEPLFELRSPGWQMVQGVSQLSLEPDEWLEVEIEVEARSRGPVVLEHKLNVSPARPLLQVSGPIAPGQTLHVAYTLASDIRMSTGTIRTRARTLDGEPADLLFRKRRFAVHRSGPRPANGAVLVRAELDPPAAGAAALTTHVRPLQAYAEFLRKRERRGMTAAQLGVEAAPESQRPAVN